MLAYVIHLAIGKNYIDRNKINNKSILIFLILTGNTRIFGAFIKSKIEVKHETYTKECYLN